MFPRGIPGETAVSPSEVLSHCEPWRLATADPTEGTAACAGFREGWGNAESSGRARKVSPEYIWRPYPLTRLDLKRYGALTRY